MKYYSLLPLSALLVVIAFSVLVHFQIIPSGMQLLTAIQGQFADFFYLLIFIIILLESIVYVGFYFPGQFFAVVLVVLNKPSWTDILMLTFCMVTAATLGSLVNYTLGKRIGAQQRKPSSFSFKSLLLAMIHMNALAFYMFNHGATGGRSRIVWLAGGLNLPYYLMLIAATAYLSEEVMQIAENTWMILIIIAIWLSISVWLDVSNRKYASS